MPSSAICAFATFNAFSSFAQIGARQSKVPSRLSASTWSRSNAIVSSPETSSLIATPKAFPLVSPWGNSFTRLFTASICGQEASGSFVISINSAVNAFFPSSGVDAWAPSPSAVIRTPSSQPVKVNVTSVSFVTAAAVSFNTASSTPATTAFAFPGTTLLLRPASILTSFGIASDFSKEATKWPGSRPFSTLITGNSASGEKVIGASFSCL